MARDTVSKKEKLYEPSIAGEIEGLLRRERIVSIRQHTSAYVSIRQHTSAYVRQRRERRESG
jgi:hypothetical protein